MYFNTEGLVAHIDQIVRFTRGELIHEARRVDIFYANKKPVVRLTNNFDFTVKDIAEIYRLRWAIESLYKQLKPESVIRLLCAYQSSFCHLSSRFSVTMDLHSSIKAKRHLPKNISSSHHNANDRFRLKIRIGQRKVKKNQRNSRYSDSHNKMERKVFPRIPCAENENALTLQRKRSRTGA